MNKDKDIKEEEKQDDKLGKNMEETNELKRQMNEIQKQVNEIAKDIPYIKNMLLKLLKKKEKGRSLNK